MEALPFGRICSFEQSVNDKLHALLQDDKWHVACLCVSGWAVNLPAAIFFGEMMAILAHCRTTGCTKLLLCGALLSSGLLYQLQKRFSPARLLHMVLSLSPQHHLQHVRISSI